MGMDADQIPELLQPEKQYLPDAEASWFENETPRHKVRLDAFYIDSTHLILPQIILWLRAFGMML